MEKSNTESAIAKSNCEDCRKGLPQFLDHGLSTEDSKAISEHLLECEDCFRVYTEMVDQRGGQENRAIYYGGRAMWGPLSWGLDDEEEHLNELLFLAQIKEKTGGVVLVKYHPVQEKSLFLLFSHLQAALEREGRQVCYADPATANDLISILPEDNHSSVYLLAPGGTQAADFEFFLEAVAIHNQAALGKVVAVIGAGREYGKEEDLEEPFAPDIYTIPLPGENEEGVRFKRRLDEEMAAIREALAAA